MKTITIKIEGENRSGRTMIGRIIYQYLNTIGFDIVFEDDICKTIYNPELDRIKLSSLKMDKQKIIIKS